LLDHAGSDGHLTARHGVDVSVVVMAASAGGLTAFSRIVSALPGDFPAPVVLVQHLCQDSPSVLAEILGGCTPLRVRQAADGDVLLRGTVYTPVPGRHLLVNTGGTLSLLRTPKVRFVRPSADVLLASAAVAFGERVVAVVLTGGGSDGAEGVRAVRQRGGFVIAQDGATSECFGMPYYAVLTGAVHLVLPLDGIAAALRTLAGTTATPSPKSTRPAT
jgi:two-component system, chemotaxis family, protein-glutamate methylesterase/glutaminase